MSGFAVKLIYAGAGVVSYLVGAIPFGYLVYRARTGKDIRKVGSGNIGATNVGRELGFRFFLLVFLLDCGKGAGPVFGARLLAALFPCPD